MRLFIALDAQEMDFDPEVALKKLKINLKNKDLEFRWVPQKNYHITINFLGEVEIEKLSELKSMLQELSQMHPPFLLKLGGLGAFPTIKEGRVIWMGVQNSKFLRSLQQDCEERLKTLGFSLEERDFRPHLTLARLRSPRQLADLLSPLINQKFGDLKVMRITLYESKLAGSFPVYEPLEKFELKFHK
jgi:RNA 2',3'-cyclic 3'-phosphodiesterase